MCGVCRYQYGYVSLVDVYISVNEYMGTSVVRMHVRRWMYACRVQVYVRECVHEASACGECMCQECMMYACD